MPYKDPEKGREKHRNYMREVWYPQNRKKHIGYVTNLKRTISEFISEYKKEKNCVDCGFKGSICPQVLEFDHLGDKKFEISMFTKHTLSLDRVKKEIEKCDLVCANCHRIRTVGRRDKTSVTPKVAKKTLEKDWFVYILKCEDGTLYTGITTELERRFEEHKSGNGARYTRSRGAAECVYTEKHATRSEALVRESAIKKMKRQDKLLLGNIEK